MNLNEKTLLAIRYLVSKSLSEQITPEESGVLEQLILSDPQARRYYAEFIQIHTCLRRLYEEAAVQQLKEGNSVRDIRLWEELAHYEMVAEPLEEAVRVQADSVPKQPIIPVQRKKPSKFSLYGLAASIAAALLLVLTIHILPAPKKAVATVTDCINCRWEGKGSELKKGDDVLNEPQKLLSGFVALRFDDGAEVLVEGPAEFTPLSAEKMLLHRGKVYAHVPNKAIGFAIDTPESSIVDLGTDFGVVVDPAAGSEVHVYEGKVNLVAGLADQPKQSEILQKHEARKVDADDGSIRSAEFKKYLFAQKISSKENSVVYGRPVSLASLTDLVLGGDGYGTSRETTRIYAVGTGQIITDYSGQYRTLNNPYQTVNSNPFIDGIFVPNGENQVISSEGHVFADCPQTSGLYYYDLFFDKNGKYAPTVSALYQKQRNLKYSPDVMFMHSNLGVTFNMDAVRLQFPDHSIRRFQATAGTLSVFRGYTILPAEELARNYTEFDVWIVVDGQLRAKAERVHWDSLIDLDVPLTAEDRFLSIVVTDGGIIRSAGNNVNHYDLCGLTDMRFEMESME